MESFIVLYPRVSEALRAMNASEPASASSQDAQSAIVKELALLNQIEGSLCQVVESMLERRFSPEDDSLRFTLSAYDFLGVSDEIRRFIGRLWGDALSVWDTGQRANFLMMAISDTGRALPALDFMVELFRRIRLTADEVFPWLKQVYRQMGGDLFAGRLWAGIEAFCATSPDEAITVASRWLDAGPETAPLLVAKNMIAYLRLTSNSDSEIRARFAALEDRVRAGGHPAWRALYIESLAYSSPGLIVSEEEALRIRDRYVRPDSEEEIAWCFLLSSVVQVSPHAEEWARREINRLPLARLAEPAKYWVVVAALCKLVDSLKSNTAAVDAYVAMFTAALPIAAESIGTWDQIYESLATLVKIRPDAATAIITILGRNSGKTWLKIAKDLQYTWFFHLLTQDNLSSGIAESLCFDPTATGRHMGLIIFSECRVKRIGSEALNRATDTQVELLFFEAQRRLMDFGALARLHASLAARIDQIGGDLATLFHEECARQCLNTYEYRTSLAAHAQSHEYLPDIVKDAWERLALTDAASKSPALQMVVPGMERAQRIHDRRLVTEVARTMKENSVLLSSNPTVTLLYGGAEFRTFLKDRPFAAPSKMKGFSATAEIPRLEFIDPETMDMRRVAAGHRIAQLERQSMVSDRES